MGKTIKKVMANTPKLNNDILKTFANNEWNKFVNDLVNVQPMNSGSGRIFTMSGFFAKMQIHIYNDKECYDEISADPNNIIIFKTNSDLVERMLTETAVECEIDIEITKISSNIWRIFCEDDIFQSTFKLKYG